jgi:hypothetical protein
MFSDGDMFLEAKQNSEPKIYRNKAMEMNVGMQHNYIIRLFNKD